MVLVLNLACGQFRQLNIMFSKEQRITIGRKTSRNHTVLMFCIHNTRVFLFLLYLLEANIITLTSNRG